MPFITTPVCIHCAYAVKHGDDDMLRKSMEASGLPSEEIAFNLTYYTERSIHGEYEGTGWDDECNVCESEKHGAVWEMRFTPGDIS